MRRHTIRTTTSRSGASESSSEIRQLRHERDSLTDSCRSLERETQRCRRALSSFETQIAQIPRSRGKLDVQRQKSNTLRADVLRLRADDSHISRNFGLLQRRSCSLQVRCNDFWRYPELTQYTDEVYHSPELEWMHMEENKHESAPTVSRGMGADDTRRLPVCPCQQFFRYCVSYLQATTKGFTLPVEIERLVKESASKKIQAEKRELERYQAEFR